MGNKNRRRKARKQVLKNVSKEISLKTKSYFPWIVFTGVVLVVSGYYLLKSNKTRTVLSTFTSHQDIFVNSPRGNKKTGIPQPIVIDLAGYEPDLADFLHKNLNQDMLKELEACTTLAEATVIVNQDLAPNYTLEKLNIFLARCQSEILNYKWQGEYFYDLPVKNQLEVLGTYLIQDKNFNYDEKNGQKPYLVSNLIETGNGNCATLPVVYAMLAEKFRLPVKLVTILDHMFARYDDGETQINIECTNPKGMGVGTPDKFYVKLLKPTPLMLHNSSCMKSLNLRQSIGALYITKMAHLIKVKKNLMFFVDSIAYSFYFNPISEHATMNILNMLKDSPDIPESFQKVMIHRARQLGAVPLSTEFLNKLGYQITLLGMAVKEEQVKIKYLYGLKLYNPYRYPMPKQPPTAQFHKIKDVRKQQDAFRKYYASIREKKIKSQNKILRVQYDIRSEIKKNKNDIAKFLNNHQYKLTQTMRQHIFDVSIQNGENWGNFQRYVP